MKFSQLAAVAAFAGLANAQSQCASLITSIPPCALGYVAEIAYSSYSCDIVNFGCQCSHIYDIAGPLGSSLGPYGSQCNLAQVLGPATDFCGCVSSNTAAPPLTLEAYQKACEASAVAIPGCALGYLASAGVGDGCQINDFACQCSKFSTIQGQISSEVQDFCGTVSVSVPQVLSSASSLCACVTANNGGPTGGPSPPVTTTPTGGPTVPTTPTGAPTIPTSTGPVTNGTSPAPPVSQKPTSTKPTNVVSLPTFTGAGVTASAFGGIFGVVAGIVAFL